MLNLEIAQARLKEYQLTDWQTIRLEKLLKLPVKLRSIGCGIFGHDDKGKPFKRDDSAKSIETSSKALGDLKSQDRVRNAVGCCPTSRRATSDDFRVRR